MTQRRIALLGGGGHASDLLGLIEVLDSDGAVFDVLIGDDDWSDPQRFNGRRGRCVGVEEALSSATEYVGATGYPASRRTLVGRAKAFQCEASPALVHPSAEISTGARLGLGVVVQGQAWLSPLVGIGQHSYVGYGAKLGHDTLVGDFCSLMPNCFVGGDVSIMDGVLVGAGAVVLQGLVIGKDAVIGAGAIVTSDVPAGITVVGRPASEVIT